MPSQVPVPPDESTRLRAVHATRLLDAPLRERFERITRLAQAIFHTRIAAITLIDDHRQWFVSIQGLIVNETSRDVAFCAYTILDEEVMVVPDARTDPRFASNPLVTGEPNIVFYAGCPLRSADGSHLGGLCIIDTHPRALTHYERDTLRDLARLAESEITSISELATQAELCEQIAHEVRRSFIDPLTRVLNRAGIFDMLAEVVDTNTTTANRQLAALMIDLDHFKSVNDTHGHPVGDEVLIAVSRRISTELRDIDHLGRVGGEEFLAVLPKLRSPDDAFEIAERVRKAIADRPVATSAGDIAVTASIGICFAPVLAAATGDAMFRTADAALYRAKKQGRNCTVLAPLTLVWDTASTTSEASRRP